MRLFFATDIHGSDVCFRKFLRAPEFYGVDALFLGGDYSGKQVVMCVRAKSGWYASLGRDRVEISTRSEFEEFRVLCWNRGALVSELSEEEFHATQADENAASKFYESALRDMLKRWASLAREQLGRTPVQIFQIPGNDDPSYCDEFFNTPPFVPLDRQHILIADDLAAMGIGGSTPTPWNTPREYEEQEIEQIIESSFRCELRDSPLIFFGHVPPWKSGLDTAPALNPDLSYKLALGAAHKEAVGSKAVRGAIERLRPILGLFGHVHEIRSYARIGKTLCVNPGSTYYDGRLRGCVVAIGDGKVIDFQLTEG